MQILSIGEKIRKLRISKGMTLKDLCEKDISVSKMSNIENGKIEPDDELLDIVSKRLNIDVESLNKTTVEEARDQIKNLSGRFYSRNYEKEFDSLLRSCIEHDLKFEIFMARAQLIDYYIYKNKSEEIDTAISNLYASFVGIVNEDTMFLYFLSMGKYLVFIKEYSKSLVFLNYLMDRYDDTPEKFVKDKKYEILIYLSYSLIYLDEIEKAKTSIDLLQKELDSGKKLSPNTRLELYLLFYVLDSLFKNNGIKIKTLSKEMIDTIKDSPENYSRAKYYIANKKMESNDVEGALDAISKFYQVFPKEKHALNIEMLMEFMKNTIDKREYEEASKYIDIVVNAAIESKSNSMMEKAYYYKAKIFYMQEDYNLAETYMWISIDLLTQNGEGANISERYEELGNIYLKLGNKKQAIKFYNLSISSDSRFTVKEI